MTTATFREGDSVDEHDKILFQRQLDTLQREFTVHRDQEESRWSHLIQLTEMNQQTAQQNAENIAELTRATQGVIETWNTANSLGKFFKWLGSFAVLAAALAWVKDHWSSFS